MVTHLPPSSSFTTPDSSSASTVDEQAVRWWVQQCEGFEKDGARSHDAFLRWLDTDPTHARAWANVQRTAATIDALPASALDALRASPRALTHKLLAPSRRSVLRVGAAAAACALLIGGAAALLHAERAAPQYAQALRTTRGQVLSVDLPDGSRIDLDTQTALDVRMYSTRRRALLEHGQALFDVKADPARPFEIEVGALRVTVVGTRFQIRHVAGHIDVEVIEGSVRVERVADGSIAESRLLSAGQAVALERGGPLSPTTTVAVDDVATWRQGRLSFDDVPLSAALAEFARYGDTGLAIPDPDVAALRVSGSFDISRVDRFAQALPRALPVRLQPRAGGVDIVAR
jgi:transmembrane sensor